MSVYVRHTGTWTLIGTYTIVVTGASHVGFRCYSDTFNAVDAFRVGAL